MPVNGRWDLIERLVNRLSTNSTIICFDTIHHFNVGHSLPSKEKGHSNLAQV